MLHEHDLFIDHNHGRVLVCMVFYITSENVRHLMQGADSGSGWTMVAT